MITEDRVCFNGVHTRRLSVAGSGVPVALLHGFTDSADMWRGVLTAFERQRPPARLHRRFGLIDGGKK